MCSLRILFIFSLCLAFIFAEKPEIHKRSKRYLTFPKGSSLVLTLVMSKPLLFKYPMNWNSLIEFDLLFPLPNMVYTHHRHRSKWVLHPPPEKDQIYDPHHRQFDWDLWRHHRRQRRDVYQQIEAILLSYEIDGPACIRRFLCEIKYLENHSLKGSLLYDWLKIIFTYSTENETIEVEEEEERAYLEAYKDCISTEYNNCPFHLNNMADFILNVLKNNIKRIELK